MRALIIAAVASFAFAGAVMAQTSDDPNGAPSGNGTNTPGSGASAPGGTMMHHHMKHHHMMKHHHHMMKKHMMMKKKSM